MHIGWCYTTNCRSTIGYCSFDWSALARNSVVAVYKALSQGICEGMWLKRLLAKLNNPPAKCDNLATIDITKNSNHHDRTKHVEFDQHFIIEKVDSMVVELVHTPTKFQTRDVLAKALP